MGQGLHACATTTRKTRSREIQLSKENIAALTRRFARHTRSLRQAWI